MKRFIFLLAVLPFLLAACGGKSTPATGGMVRVEGGTYRNVSAVELNTLLQKKDFILVNVHMVAI